MFKRGLLAILITIGFIGTSCVMMTGGDETGIDGTRAGEGDKPYCRFYTNGATSGYPGDEIEFYMSVSKHYSGWDWIGGESNRPSGYDYLIEAKLYIWDNSTLDEDGLLVNFISPGYNGGMTPDNGQYSMGYNISGYRNYFSDTDNYIRFRFTISSEYTKAGIIQIPVKLVFKVMHNYMGNNQIEYRSIGQMGYISFDIRSNLAGSEFRGMELNGYEGNANVPIYAGAKYIMIRGNQIRSSTVDTLTEVDAKIEWYSKQVHSDRKRLYLVDLGSSSEQLMWHVDVETDTLPMQVNGSVVYSYFRSGNHFIEGPYKIYFNVVPTPMICVPQTYNTTEPSVTVRQKESVQDFNIEFKNIGNVPFKTVTVRMDLDQANFVGQYDFVYDEGDMGRKKYPMSEFHVEDVEPGDFFTAVFPRIGIEHMLAPGDYKIPIDYTATYVDPFDETELEPRILTAQWDEAGWNDYREIQWYRADPRPTYVEEPYFIMRVLDDSLGPDIDLHMDEGIMAGSVNVPITLNIYNQEYYNLVDVSLKIRSGDMNVVAGHGTIGFDPTIVDVAGLTLPAGSSSGSGILQLNANIDVSSRAESGKFSLFVSLDGKNDRGETIKVNRTMAIDIIGRPGDLEIVGVQSTDLIPGEEFEVNVTVMNTGDSIISEAGVMLFAYHNLLAFSNPMIEQIDIEPGTVRYLVFRCTLSEIAESGSEVAIVAVTSFRDQIGNTVGYFENGVENINLRVSYVEWEQSLHVISTETSEIVPGEEFDLKITVMNRGDLAVDHFEIMVESLNNEVTILTPPEIMPGLEPGQTSSMTFRCKASEIMEPGSEITLTTRTSYKDGDGNEIGYFDFQGEEISIVSSPPPKDTDLSDSVSTAGNILLVGVILFALILIIALAFLIYATMNRGKERKDKKPKKTEGKEKSEEEKEESIYDNVPPLPKEEAKPDLQQGQGPPPSGPPQAGMNLPSPSTPSQASPEGPGNPFIGGGAYTPPGQPEPTSLDDLFD